MRRDQANIRKREVIHICDGGDGRAVKCDVAEGGVVKRLVTVPVHSKRDIIVLRSIQWITEERMRSLKNLLQSSCN